MVDRDSIIKVTKSLQDIARYISALKRWRVNIDVMLLFVQIYEQQNKPLGELHQKHLAEYNKYRQGMGDIRNFVEEDVKVWHPEYLNPNMRRSREVQTFLDTVKSKRLPFQSTIYITLYVMLS